MCVAGRDVWWRWRRRREEVVVEVAGECARTAVHALFVCLGSAKGKYSTQLLGASQIHVHTQSIKEQSRLLVLPLCRSDVGC